jgi:SNF2 family DNA or RNA helicase
LYLFSYWSFIYISVFFFCSNKVGNHPYTLELARQKREQKKKASSSSSSSLPTTTREKKEEDEVVVSSDDDDGLRKEDKEVTQEWWEGMLSSKHVIKALFAGSGVEKDACKDSDNQLEALARLEHSGKMVLLMQLIDKTLERDEKMLVFSQSIPTLDMIQRLLVQKELPSKVHGIA